MWKIAKRKEGGRKKENQEKKQGGIEYPRTCKFSKAWNVT
jgi:hypothetical protein